LHTTGPANIESPPPTINLPRSSPYALSRSRTGPISPLTLPPSFSLCSLALVPLPPVSQPVSQPPALTSESRNSPNALRPRQLLCFSPESLLMRCNSACRACSFLIIILIFFFSPLRESPLHQLFAVILHPLASSWSTQQVSTIHLAIALDFLLSAPSPILRYLPGTLFWNFPSDVKLVCFLSRTFFQAFCDSLPSTPTSSFLSSPMAPRVPGAQSLVCAPLKLHRDSNV